MPQRHSLTFVTVCVALSTWLTVTALHAEPIRIGGAFALTGEGASLDVPAAAGAELAVRELNEAGGIDGRPVELLVRDTQSLNTPTFEACTRLVREDKVAAVIGFSDTKGALACGPAVMAGGIPFISVGATAPKIPKKIGKMAYLACFGDNVQAAAGAAFGIERFGKTAFLIWDDSEKYTELLATYFRRAFSSLGGVVVGEDSYDEDTTEFSASISAIKALPGPPDFLYIAAMPHNVGRLLKQFREAGLTGPVIGGDGYDTPDLPATAGAASENVYFTTHAFMDESRGSNAMKAFFASYERLFRRKPENAFAALGYDTVRLLADAIHRAASTDSEPLLAAIQATTGFEGITGRITYPGGGHIPLKAVTIIAVRDGRFTLAAETTPTVVPAP